VFSVSAQLHLHLIQLSSLTAQQHIYSIIHDELPLPHPISGLFSSTTWVSWYQKAKTSLDLTEARDDGWSGWMDAVASAGPHTNNLHLDTTTTTTTV